MVLLFIEIFIFMINLKKINYLIMFSYDYCLVYPINMNSIFDYYNWFYQVPI